MKIKFNDLSKDGIFLSLFFAYMARSVSAFGSFFLVVVMGRLFGSSGVGVFTLAQSIYLGASILSKYGLDSALMRYVGQDFTSRNIVRYLNWGLFRSLQISILAAISIYYIRDHVSGWFGMPALAEILPGVALSIPAITLSFVLSGFMKGVRKPAAACLLENGSVALVACLILLVMELFFHLSIIYVGWVMALASWIVLLQGIVQVYLWFNKQDLEVGSHDLVSHSEFSRSSRVFFVTSFAPLMQSVGSFILAGALLSSEDLGLFRSAERTAMMISFVLVVINSVFPPRFASLYRNGNYHELSDLAKKGAILGLFLASPMLLLCLFLPGSVLGLFGDGFDQAENLLRIIAFAQLVNVSTGSVGFLLNMTGHEKLMRNIALSSNLIGLILSFFLMYFLHAFGAALALSFVLVLQNTVALFYVWKKLNIWVFPVPNLLSRNSEK